MRQLAGPRPACGSRPRDVGGRPRFRRRPRRTPDTLTYLESPLLTIGIRTFVPAEHATARATVLVAGPAPPAHLVSNVAVLALILTVVLLVTAGKSILKIVDLIGQFLELVLFWVLLRALTGLGLAVLLTSH